MPDESRATTSPRRWPAALLGLAAVLLCIALFHTFFPADPMLPPAEARRGYDARAMRQALSPKQVQDELTTLRSFGSRAPGQAGYVRTQDHLASRFESMGYELLRHRFSAVTEATDRAEIVDSEGRPLPDVEVWPFRANHLQPMVTPEEGLEGELVRVTDQMLETRKSFEGAIALIDLNQPPSDLELVWERYALLGFQAVIYAHPERLAEADWTVLSDGDPISAHPINFVRLAASPEVFDHVGERVRLNVRTAYENAPSQNLLAVRRAAPSGGESADASDASSSGRTNHSRREAIIVFAPYDAFSVLPSRAPGAMSAVNTAALLSAAEGVSRLSLPPQRDVIFIATGHEPIGYAGLNALLGAAGVNGRSTDTLRYHRTQLEESSQRAESVSALLGRFDEPAFMTDPDPTTQALSDMAGPVRRFFTEQLKYVVNQKVFHANERRLQRELEFIRQGKDTSHPSYKEFLDAKKIYDELQSVAGYRAVDLLTEPSRRNREKSVAQMYDLRQAYRDRLESLRAHHESRRLELESRIEVCELLSSYDRTLWVQLALAPKAGGERGAETVTLFMGPEVSHETNGLALSNLLSRVASRMPADGARFEYQPVVRNHEKRFDQFSSHLRSVRHINKHAYVAFAFGHVNRGVSYGHWSSPVEEPWMTDTNSVKGGLRLVADSLLELVYGSGRINPPASRPKKTRGGRVYAGQVGQSIVPSFPLSDAAISSELVEGVLIAGRNRRLIDWTDPYGRFETPFAALDYFFRRPWSPDAVVYGEDGLIQHIKDEGPVGQRVYKSMDVQTLGEMNIVTFRASSTSMFDLINPQTLKSYAGAEFLTQKGLTAFEQFNKFSTDPASLVTFVPPNSRFFVALKAGSVENELVQETRAFMLGPPNPELPPDAELNGLGYLAADTPVLGNVPQKTGASMTRVNEKRLDLQQEYELADEQTVRFHETSKELLERAQTPETPFAEKLRRAREAVTYAILVHPILRNNIFEAVVSILYYLCLLVPFVFFFEKLIFGFNDIRKQLTAHCAIFLGVFVLLKVLHPAFEMIRSSSMILLGFIIMLISVGVSMLFTGKFNENLEQLKQKRGQVSAAEVNTLGVIGTAFLLGLNNMHRRKVRTGLTCATLVLITFAMICFTGVQSDIVNQSTAVGKAAYQGVLIENENLARITESEQYAIRSKYAHKYSIATRRYLVGQKDLYTLRLEIPEIQIEHRQADGRTRRRDLKGLLVLDHNEPLRHEYEFLTEDDWFTESDFEISKRDVRPIILPDTLAKALEVTPEMVNAEEAVQIRMNGETYQVRSIVTAESLRAAKDLDGANILPFDVEAMTTVTADEFQTFATEPYPRISTDRLAILAIDPQVGLSSGTMFAASITIDMTLDRRTGAPLNYRQAREEITRYLEQSGEETYYGLDEVAFVGRRAREQSLAGLIDLFIPLAIAGLTVLNTMKGSVYERKDEIFVYNAVGIAPRYIFAMFFAEALVYVVVGSLLGYLLSQGVGRILTELNLTGGLNMTFSDLGTIYASLTVGVATFISTYFPARSAMEIAAPAEESGWDLPEPEGDRLSFTLPFTFTARDRVAVLAFFGRHFDDHGEGSGGKFFASPSSFDVQRADADRVDETMPESPNIQAQESRYVVPSVSTTIWLKPFDLGVSQALQISTPIDEQTGEFIAHLTLERLSGTSQAWLRLNHAFMKQVRKNFLFWRAVPPAQRAELFDEAARRYGREPADTGESNDTAVTADYDAGAGIDPEGEVSDDAESSDPTRGKGANRG